MKFTTIKTVAAAFKALGIDPNFKPDVTGWPEDMQAHKIVEYQLQMVVRAVNGKWKANWSDKSQRKYYPWWWIVEKENGVSGSGLSFDGAGFGNSRTDVAPRLVLESPEKVAHMVKYFLPLYEAYYLAA